MNASRGTYEGFPDPAGHRRASALEPCLLVAWAGSGRSTGLEARSRASLVRDDACESKMGSHSSRAPEDLGEQIILYRQLAQPRVEFVPLAVIRLNRMDIEDIIRALEQALLPVVDLFGMDMEPPGQFRRGVFTLKGRRRHLRLER